MWGRLAAAVVVVLQGCVALANIDDLVYEDDGAGGSGGTAAQGGDGMCFGCAAVLDGGDVGSEQLCGFVSKDSMVLDYDCEPNSSCARLDDLVDCVCAACPDSCADLCNGKEQLAESCNACIVDECVGVLNACLVDD